MKELTEQSGPRGGLVEQPDMDYPDGESTTLPVCFSHDAHVLTNIPKLRVE